MTWQEIWDDGVASIREMPVATRTERHSAILAADRDLTALRERCARLEKVEQALRGIADAKRFNRDHFKDDTDFADWVKSRSNFTIRAYDDAALDAVKEGSK